jgi:hypothetical protein
VTNRVLALLLIAAATMPAVATAQFASDIPGVPRASLPLQGSKQTRSELQISGYKLAGTDGRDTMSVAARIGFGRSYRVTSSIELGFDFTLVQGRLTRTPRGGTTADSTETSIDGLALYGLRIGGKLRPYSDLSPEGYGLDLAIGASIGPPLKPVFGFSKDTDTTMTGGYVGGSDAEDNPLFNTLRSWVQVAAMVSYRTQRLILDAAVVSEGVGKAEDTGDISQLGLYSGVTPRVGAMFRVTPSVALGASYWGDGAPAWRDDVVLGLNDAKPSQYGAILTLGSKPEAGTDIMVTAPNGSFSESLRLYVRWRGTK